MPPARRFRLGTSPLPVRPQPTHRTSLEQGSLELAPVKVTVYQQQMGSPCLKVDPGIETPVEVRQVLVVTVCQGGLLMQLEESVGVGSLRAVPSAVGSSALSGPAMD